MPTLPNITLWKNQATLCQIFCFNYLRRKKVQIKSGQRRDSHEILTCYMTQPAPASDSPRPRSLHAGDEATWLSEANMHLEFTRPMTFGAFSVVPETNKGRVEHGWHTGGTRSCKDGRCWLSSRSYNSQYVFWWHCRYFFHFPLGLLIIFESFLK